MKSLVPWAFAAALFLSLCTLQIGLAVDDWPQLLRARGQLPDAGHPWDLFTFSAAGEGALDKLILNGPFPWWTDPRFRLGFFRPLSSALIHFDVDVIGPHVLAWHLHSIAWYFALLVIVLALLRRVLPAPAVGVAMLLFVLDDAHWLPIGWLANRNSLVAATFGVGGLIMHLKWREDGWRRGAWLAALCYVLALCGGESAFGVLAFVVAYELTAVRPEPLKRRALALAPLFAVVLPWLTVHRALGYGVRHSGAYLDPLKEPLEYLAVAPGRLFALLGSLTLGLGSDLWIFVSSGRAVMVAVGVVGTVLYIVWLRRGWRSWPDEQRRRMRWLICGTLLALLPVMSAFPTDRLLLVPSIGGAAIAATLLTTLWSQRGALAQSAKAVIVWAQMLAPLPAWVVGPMWYASTSAYVERGMLDTPLSDAALAKRVVLVTAPDPLVGMYGWAARLAEGRPTPLAWHTLSYDPHVHRLKRTSETSFELSVVDGRILDTVFEQMMQRNPIGAGFVARLATLTVTVLEATEGHPTRIRVDLTAAPDEITLVEWRDGRLMPLLLPPVGEEIVLGLAASPFGQMNELLHGRF